MLLLVLLMVKWHILYNPSSVTLDNSTELRNPRYIADASWSGNVATIVTEVPHDLKTRFYSRNC